MAKLSTSTCTGPQADEAEAALNDVDELEPLNEANNELESINDADNDTASGDELEGIDE